MTQCAEPYYAYYYFVPLFVDTVGSSKLHPGSWDGEFPWPRPAQILVRKHLIVAMNFASTITGIADGWWL